MAGIWNTTILKIPSHPNMLGLSHTESSVSAVFQEKLFHTALLLTCYRRIKGKLLPFRLQELILDNSSQPKTLNKGYRLSNQCLSTSLTPPPLPNFSHCSSATGNLIKHLATLSCAALQDKTHACQISGTCLHSFQNNKSTCQQNCTLSPAWLVHPST